MENQKGNTDPIYCQDAGQLAKMIRDRGISPVEVVKVHLDRIKALKCSVTLLLGIYFLFEYRPQYHACGSR